MYAIWDAESNDVLMLPGRDRYARALFPTMDELQYCLGPSGDTLVKITIEHVAKPQ